MTILLSILSLFLKIGVACWALGMLWMLYELQVGRHRVDGRLYVGHERTTQQRLCDDALRRVEEHDITVDTHLNEPR